MHVSIVVTTVSMHVTTIISLHARDNRNNNSLYARGDCHNNPYAREHVAVDYRLDVCRATNGAHI